MTEAELLDVTCLFAGCGRHIFAKSLCETHYKQKRAGKTLTPIKFKRSSDQSVADVVRRRTIRDGGCLIWQGSRSSGGYALGGKRYGTKRIHRQLYIETFGDPGPSKVIDHTCNRGADGCVTLECLEAVTQAENIQRARVSRNNTSGYTGVSWAKNVLKWHAYGRRNGRKVTFGYFEELEDAVEARRLGVQELLSNDQRGVFA